MSNLRALEALEILELIAAADDLRASGDPFKLPTGSALLLRNVVNARRATLAANIGAASLAEGDRAGASLASRMALTNLEKAHRFGYKYIAGLTPDWVTLESGAGPYISDSLRLQQFHRYGFVGGNVGEFTDARTEELARQVPIAAAVSLSNVQWHYSADLQDYIAGQLTLVDAYASLATGGTRELATDAVNTAADEGELVIARVRGHYIGASDMTDRTPELKRIGLQPRRQPGEAGGGVVPDAPGTAVYDAAANTLTVPAIPGNANSLRAYRKRTAPTAGPLELAGISLNTTVSLVMAGPLDADATYEAWVVGYDGNDEGPEGNHVTITT